MKTYSNMDSMRERDIKDEEFPTNTKAIIRAWLCNGCWLSLVKMDSQYFFVHRKKSMNTGCSRLTDMFLWKWVEEGLKFQQEVRGELQNEKIP